MEKATASTFTLMPWNITPYRGYGYTHTGKERGLLVVGVGGGSLAMTKSIAKLYVVRVAWQACSIFLASRQQ